MCYVDTPACPVDTGSHNRHSSLSHQQRSLRFRLSIGLASMRQCSNFRELDDGSDRERVHSGIKQIDQDINLLEFAAIVSNEDAS